MGLGGGGSSGWGDCVGRLGELLAMGAVMILGGEAAQCAALKVVGSQGLEPWTKGL